MYYLSVHIISYSTGGHCEKIPNVIQVGQNVHLYCFADKEDVVNWFFIPVTSNQLHYIYYDNTISERYNSRIAVEKSTEGQHILTIFSIQLSDAGRYIAGKMNSRGEINCSELVIFGKFLFIHNRADAVRIV